MDEKENRPQFKPEVDKRQVDCLSLPVSGCSRIFVFRNETQFLEALAANPHLQVHYGAKDYEKDLFPGLFIASTEQGR